MAAPTGTKCYNHRLPPYEKLKKYCLNRTELLVAFDFIIVRPKHYIGALAYATTTILVDFLIITCIFFYLIGNVFVIAAIILERNLQNVANYLVASLAVADLFVACLVMPLGAVYEVKLNSILYGLFQVLKINLNES